MKQVAQEGDGGQESQVPDGGENQDRNEHDGARFVKGQDSERFIDEPLQVICHEEEVDAAGAQLGDEQEHGYNNFGRSSESAEMLC